METKPNKRIDVSRPKDRSLEAYKEWVRELAKRLTRENWQFKMTEEEWVINWNEYWDGQTNRK